MEPEEEPDLEDRVYLNVAIYNQGRRSRCLPAGVPVVSLRGSGKKERKQLLSGSGEIADQIVRELTEQLEGQAKVRVDEARRAWRTPGRECRVGANG